ncbi:MAG: hypothetical protein ACTSU5_18135 [Promethearchaeota archaeon]
MKERISSYSRGIDNLLKDSEKFEEILAEYIIRTNSHYFSNVFPSTQLAKIVLNKLEERRTKFPIIHRLVREILKKWADSGVCVHVTTTKYSKSRTKTKEVYKFHGGGLAKLKELIIKSSIQKISAEVEPEKLPSDSLKTREEMIEDLQREFEDFFYLMESESEN